MDPERFRAAAHAVVDGMADYLATVDRRAVLPPIEPGLDKVAFQRILQERVEAASDRLLAEGRAELAARGMDPLANS